MNAPTDDLQRIGVQLFAADGVTVAPRELIAIFHRWIQTNAIADQLLIDVADYSHVPDGPGVLLVAHEGNFAVAHADGRTAITYIRKQPSSGTLAQRLQAAARIAVTAGRMLEDEPSLRGRLRFRGEELTVLANDRLRAANTDETRTALQPAVDALARKLDGSADCIASGASDQRERLRFRVTAPRPLSLRDLSARLA